MKTYYAESVVRPDHKVEVDHVPFGQGESVAVFMVALEKAKASSSSVSLRGSIVIYESPFEAVSQNDWEAHS